MIIVVFYMLNRILKKFWIACPSLAPSDNGVGIFLNIHWDLNLNNLDMIVEDWCGFGFRIFRAGTIRVESPNTSALSPSWMRENPQLGAEPGD